MKETKNQIEKRLEDLQNKYELLKAENKSIISENAKLKDAITKLKSTTQPYNVFTYFDVY